MPCSDCRKWLTQRVTDYEDGSRIINLSCEDGRGRCEELNIETAPDFGCVRFIPGNNHIEIMGRKTGSPWHHSQWGGCPDCGGVGVSGGGACRRCAQTGRVLYYDDGYVGEEQTRMHPNEVAKGPPPPPKCQNCDSGIDLKWVACPHCGWKIPHPDEPVRVAEFVP